MAFSTARQWNGWNFFICCLVSIGSFAFGYPASIISVTLAQPSFLVDMGLLDVTQTPPAMSSNADGIIGAMSGVFQAGACINVFIAGWVADTYGRKWAFHFCSFLSLLGGAILCGATSSSMFIVGRLFAGAGSYGFLTVAPFYSAELAPPSLRGLMVGMNGINIAIGYALAVYMGLAFYHTENPSTQWRAPLGLALIWPLVMIAVCFIVPESPRYLLMQGKVDEARDIELKLHAVKGDQEFARAEFYQMAKQAEIDRQLTPSWIEMFRKPSYRKRMILATGFAFFGQSSGVLVLNNYGPTIYAALGYGTLKQITFQAGWVTVGIAGNVVGAFIMDRLGRKPLLIAGLVGCSICLIIEAAIVSSFAEAGTNKAGLRMGVAATYIFLFIYSLGIDVAGVVFYSELFPNHIRARGMALSIFTISLTDLVYLQAAPTAFRTIGWKFYLLFIILSALGAVWVWFTIPETKGIPLEEMARVFGDEVAVYEADIHVDNTAKELMVGQQGANNGSPIDPNMLRHSIDQRDPEKAVHEPVSNTEHVDNIDK